jgi:hypothetical protein
MNRNSPEAKPRYLRSSSCKRPTSSTQQSPSSKTQNTEKSSSKKPIQRNLQSPGPNSYVKKIFETMSRPPTNHQTSVISNKSVASRGRTTGVNQKIDLKPGTFSLKQTILRGKSPPRENYWENPHWRAEAKTPGICSAANVLPSFNSVALSVAETDFEHGRRFQEVLLPWQKLMREFDREEIISN